MKKLASAAIAAILVGTMAIPAPASAQSASFNFSVGQQERFVNDRCRIHPNWRGCDDWRRNHNRWSRDDYRRWYRWNQPSLGGVAAGLFGFAVGAAIANSVNNGSVRSGGYGAYDDHVARCEARYRSYSAETDMYLGFDGYHHRCNL